MKNKDKTMVENDTYNEPLKYMQDIEQIVRELGHMHTENLRFFDNLKGEIASLKKVSPEFGYLISDYEKFLDNEYVRVDRIIYNFESNLVIDKVNKFFEKKR